MTKREWEQRDRLMNNLARLGFEEGERHQLRRIEMTLQRWAELECGDGNDFASWSVERDEETGKPFMVTHPRNDNKSRRRAIPDRETGALKRLAKIVEARNARVAACGGIDDIILPYHQSDPRGCALYLCLKSDIGDGDISSLYTRGLAVCG